MNIRIFCREWGKYYPKKDVDEEEEIEGKNEDNTHDRLVVEEGMTVKFLLVSFATFAGTVSRLFLARRSKTTT